MQYTVKTTTSLTRISNIRPKVRKEFDLMKIYISLPIGGYEKSVRARYERAKEEILRDCPDAIISGPLNINDFDDEGYHCPTENLNEIGRDHPWEWYIGEDVKELLTCDAIYMTRGWNWSRGCKIELAIAEADDMQRMYADDSNKMLTKDE